MTAATFWSTEVSFGPISTNGARSESLRKGHRQSDSIITAVCQKIRPNRTIVSNGSFIAEDHARARYSNACARGSVGGNIVENALVSSVVESYSNTKVDLRVLNRAPPKFKYRPSSRAGAIFHLNEHIFRTQDIDITVY